MLVKDTPPEILPDSVKQRISDWGVTNFTEIQVAALNTGVAAGRSQVVCAPTSSGKTLVGEIAILAALGKGKRSIYLVSHKALADQKYIDFRERFGDQSASMLGSVGLSTGDRDEGDIASDILVATYEKALALLLSGQLELHTSLVVADELQIIGEKGRGPNIETLCSIIKKNGIEQFLALTATVGNAEEISEWLGCSMVASHSRDVDLFQEIWTDEIAYSIKFGQRDAAQCHTGKVLQKDPVEVARQLIAMSRGPVLVFTESRNEASKYAERYSRNCVRTDEGIALSEELELFSEPTESSEQLQTSAQKRVAFHTADLTSQQRGVIESGFIASKFDVCFATSTLAAGVNFPFRSVVFPKLTYQYGDRSGQMVSRSDYRNMSGRAGRLGLHTDGFAILLPKNAREAAHSEHLVQPENDNIESQLVSVSMRRTVLSLVSSRVVSDSNSLEEFFQHTFYWHQIRETNADKLDDVVSVAQESMNWLIQNGFLEADQGYVMPTPLGNAVAQSGLLPSTALQFLKTMTTYQDAIEEDFEIHIPSLIHWICCCDEFQGETPSRFLPYPIGRDIVQSVAFLQSVPLITPLDRTNDQVNQCSHALVLYCTGEADRKIRFQTNISSGQLHRLAVEVSWIIEGLRRIACVRELGFSQSLTNKLSMLSRQMQWGAPAEALDILRVAQREGVPGFGRQRAVSLMQGGIKTFDELLGSTLEKISPIVGGVKRASALLNAIAGSIGSKANRFESVHATYAEHMGISDVWKDSSLNLGVDYETAIEKLLNMEHSWEVRVLDDGRQQNVPDIMISLGGKSVLIECKTTIKKPPLIKKEEAFAVLQKAADYDLTMPRVTLGKPGFCEHSKQKAQSSKALSLIEHDIFMEGMMRLLAKEITPDEFLEWLSNPGLTELDRLGGRPIYEVIRDL